ncbi:phosphate acetyltransferase [Candidatus Pseudothioglobus singularis]|nr:phosphate acetyltransferase [Candidatus Pseudothioglobus singularis]MDA8854920.1 phosphate acetyltransferase [Candidatus Pseudothioglobus singularis]
MPLLDDLTSKAKSKYPRILLPESTDSRIIAAAKSIKDQKIAQIVLFDEEPASSLGLESINPKNEDLKAQYAQTLFELRKHKGVTVESALEMLSNKSVFAMMALQRGDVDGVVTGAITPSQEVLSNALRIVGVAEGSKLVSSLFLMVFDDNHSMYGGNLIFSDCAMNINPNSEELAEIAKSAYETAQSFLTQSPKLAMLSFSTNQSAKHAEVDKVREATELLRSSLPDINVIGNVQLDAALDPDVLKIKDSDSSFLPPANVFIFPNLDAGNIGYKLVQRFSGARAIGPILQGLSKPVNDLSRGCSVDEIINTVVVTANQCK